MKIISIINYKGGVGKTTITQNLAVALVKKHYRVGIIDMDKQAHLSTVFGYDESVFSEAQIPDLTETIKTNDKLSIQHFQPTITDNLYILPAKKDEATVALFHELGKEKRVDSMFVFDNFVDRNLQLDYIIIDCSPLMELPAVNALLASNYVLIPAEEDKLSVQSTVDFLEYLRELQQISQQKLELLGVVINNHVRNRKLNGIVEDTLTKYSVNILKRKIRQNESLKQAQAIYKDIYEYETKYQNILNRRGIDDFDHLSQEILNIILKIN